MSARSSLNRDRGLPSNQVHSLDQDDGGRLWLAGPGGLACYDGNWVRTFDRSNVLECAGLRSVRVDGDTVWVGTDRGLEAVTLAGRAVGWAHGVDRSFGLVDAIEVCAGGVWLATAQGLLRLEDDRTGSSLRLAFRADIGFVSGLARVDADTVLAVSARRGLVELSGDDLRPVGFDALPPPESIACVALGADGEILVGTENRLWVGRRDGSWSKLAGPADPHDVMALAVDGERWWVGSGRHLLGYRAPAGGRAQLVSMEVYDSRINAIFVDAVGNVWIGTDTSGAHRASCLRDAIELVDTGRPGAVYSIKPVSATSLRVGGDGLDASLEIAAEGDITACPHGELSTTVWDSVADTARKMTWLATQDGLFTSTAGAAPCRYGAGEPLLNTPCRVLLWRKDELLVGTLAGLVRIRDQQVEEVLADDGTSLGYVYTLVVDASGELWVGTLGRGLWRERGGQLELVSGGPLSRSGNVYAVAPHPAGARLVVIQEERIVLLDDAHEPRLLGTRHPVAGWSALWIDEATIAVGSSDGLSVMNARSGHIERQINVLLGSDAWEFTSSRSLAVGPDGRLYGGVSAGLVAVDLERLRRFQEPPTPKLSDIAWRDVAPAHSGEQRFRLQPGKWSVGVSVYAGWLVDEEQVRFRFRLVGFEKEWSELSRQPDVRYSSLPPGRYELEVQAFAPLCGYSEPARLLALEVASHWWAGALVPLTTFYERFVRSAARNRELLEQRAELEQEISQRTGALERAGDELEAALRRAEEANRFKSQFLANMSHEIRTPMNAVIGFTDLLVAEEREPRKARWLHLVRTASRNLLNLIDDILDFSKIEAGKLQIEPRSFSLRALIADLTDMFAMKRDDTGIEFVVELSDAVPDVVLGDDHRLNQVLINLLGNAFKFTERGHVRLAVSYAAGVARLEVSDTGKGISPDQRRRIFDAFDQGDRSTTRQFGGTGLGLAISRHLVELMRGEISVRSNLGAGSTFTVTLPLPAAAPDVALPVDDPPHAGEGQSLRAVLLSDDESAAARLTAVMSGSAPWSVLRVEPRGDVVTAVLDAAPDLVILGPLDDEAEVIDLNDRLRRAPRTAALPLLQALASGDDSRAPLLAAIDVVAESVSDAELGRRARALAVTDSSPRRIAVIESGSRLGSMARSAFPQAAVTTFDQPRAALEAGARSSDLAIVSASTGSEHRADLEAVLAELLSGSDGAVAAPALLLVGTTAAGAIDLAHRAATAMVEPAAATERTLDTAARSVQERSVRGARMVEAWLAAQRSDKLRRLIVDNLANRMAGELRQLEAAVLDLELAEVRRLAHGMKSWSGSYKMTEVYEEVAAIDGEAARDSPNIEVLRDCCFELARHLHTVPRSYWTGTASDDEPARRREAGELRVLVVDDNEMNQLLAVAIIEEVGVTADVASNGALALEALREQRYDLVLLDMEMPVMDGWQTIEAIRGDAKLADLHVIAFTALAMRGEAERCIAAGCDDYLSKPIEPPVLANRIRGRMAGSNEARV